VGACATLLLVVSGVPAASAHVLHDEPRPAGASIWWGDSPPICLLVACKLPERKPTFCLMAPPFEQPGTNCAPPPLRIDPAAEK